LLHHPPQVAVARFLEWNSGVGREHVHHLAGSRELRSEHHDGLRGAISRRVVGDNPGRQPPERHPPDQHWKFTVQ
jgi:hypothetical protein